MRWVILATAGVVAGAVFLQLNPGIQENPPRSGGELCEALLSDGTCAAFTAAGNISQGRAPVSAAAAMLPEPLLVPGAINPAVSQANIGQTICAADYAERHSPDLAYMGKAKRLLLEQQFNPGRHNEFSLDHLIPVSLGGAARAAQNLWLQPRFAQFAADQKDRLEQVLLQQVCSGALPLATAQRAIAGDWISTYRMMIEPVNIGDEKPSNNGALPLPNDALNVTDQQLSDAETGPVVLEAEVLEAPQIVHEME